MKKIILISFFFASFLFAKGQSNFVHGRVIVSPNAHLLQYEDGTPFFWLGDTAWELFHRLKIEEINTYLKNRQEKGFNVIQAVILAEFDGLRKPDFYGDKPLINQNPETPNEKYFQFVDKVVKMAEKDNLYIALLPTWGDKVTPNWGAGPVIFNIKNAYLFGHWIGNRYKASPNILWVLGGDRPAVKDTNDWRPIWRAMARGILDATGHKAFITYHPSGGTYSTSQFIHAEPWLAMNMVQSGHGGGHDVPVWTMICRDFNIRPTKPVLDAEPNYEDHPVNPWPKWDPGTGYYRAYDVRKQIYRSVFSGACGVTYGHHSVWQFYSSREEKVNYADRYWTEALDRPGAIQAGYLLCLIGSRPSLNRIPDQEIIANGQGEKGQYACAFRDSSGTYLMVYIPCGKKITVNTTHLRGEHLNGWWFNPQDGKTTPLGSLHRELQMDFTTPTISDENDWVLILDDERAKYDSPSKTTESQR